MIRTFPHMRFARNQIAAYGLLFSEPHNIENWRRAQICAESPRCYFSGVCRLWGRPDKIRSGIDNKKSEDRDERENADNAKDNCRNDFFLYSLFSFLR